MLLYQLGELFQDMAVGKSRKSIASLMDIRPDSANVIRDGKVVTVSPEDVKKSAKRLSLSRAKKSSARRICY
ncbi:MAG: hypothetical protein L6V93_07965 [Clostridiales bacterium]|nr:MAG: hypothetical protein L6V93_07965 [Clostridiales bacterium]